MNNLKINTRKVAAILGMSLGLSLISGCSHKKNDDVVSDVVNSVADTSCFDEVLTSRFGNDMLPQLDQLQEYLYLSDTINDLKLNRFDINANAYSLLSPYAIKKILVSYLDRNKKGYFSSLEKGSLDTELVVQERLINDYLCNYGYSLAGNFLLTILKSEIFDAIGICPQDASFYDVSILSSDYSHINTVSGINDYIQLTDSIRTADWDIRDALQYLYYMQDNSNSNVNDSSYNSKRNQMIRTAINYGLRVLENEYVISEGYMKKIKK